MKWMVYQIHGMVIPVDREVIDSYSVPFVNETCSNCLLMNRTSEPSDSWKGVMRTALFQVDHCLSSPNKIYSITFLFIPSMVYVSYPTTTEKRRLG
jgi:hypothetical protein